MFYWLIDWLTNETHGQFFYRNTLQQVLFVNTSELWLTEYQAGAVNSAMHTNSEETGHQYAWYYSATETVKNLH